MTPYLFNPPGGAAIIGHGPGCRLSCHAGHLAVLADDRAAAVRKTYGDGSLAAVAPAAVAKVAQDLGCKIDRKGPNGDAARIDFLLKHPQDFIATALSAAARVETRESLMELSVKALKALAKKRNIDLPASVKVKADIVAEILPADEEG